MISIVQECICYMICIHVLINILLCLIVFEVSWSTTCVLALSVAKLKDRQTNDCFSRLTKRYFKHHPKNACGNALSAAKINERQQQDCLWRATTFQKQYFKQHQNNACGNVLSAAKLMERHKMTCYHKLIVPLFGDKSEAPAPITTTNDPLKSL